VRRCERIWSSSAWLASEPEPEPEPESDLGGCSVGGAGALGGGGGRGSAVTVAARAGGDGALASREGIGGGGLFPDHGDRSDVSEPVEVSGSTSMPTPGVWGDDTPSTGALPVASAGLSAA